MVLQEFDAAICKASANHDLTQLENLRLLLIPRFMEIDTRIKQHCLKCSTLLIEKDYRYSIDGLCCKCNSNRLTQENESLTHKECVP
jgi:hypothetical protein